MAGHVSKAAPWWHYVLVLAVGNAIMQAVLRWFDVDELTNVVITVVLIVVLAAAVTVFWRRRTSDAGRASR